MGNTMRLGCRRTFFRKPDCLTSKLYGHSILSWLIIYSLALLNLVCIETQPIDATIQKQFLTQLCYLELYVLGSLCSCCTAFQNVAFVQLNFGASPLLLTISRSCLIQNYYAHCNLEYCMKFLGMDVLHMQMSVIVIDTRFAINLFFCKHPVILFVHCKSYAYDYSFLLFKQVNPYFVPMLENAGLHFVGCDESGNRMEVLSKHPMPFLY